ncbi:hypothetical protein EON65_27530 [archaeon]|nr:MAG: hypothetical protein EON65_27530 [archaeon]
MCTYARQPNPHNLFFRLSGGAYLGYYHLGVVKALFEEGLLPRVISGASAGSIMTAIVG